MASDLVKIIADFSTTLVTKVAVGATTATLTSATDDDGVALPAGTYGFTIDRNSANKEYFTATLSGTSLTDVKTVTRGTGVGTSGFAMAHRKGAEVIISDHVALKRMLDLLDGTTDLDSTNPFMYDGTATISDAKHIATKAYVDGVAIAGAPDASTTVKGITKLSVAPASPTDPIAVGDNDTRFSTVSGTALSASNKVVDHATISGVISMWGTTTAPTGWLLCDGSAVSRSTYSVLFGILGTTYGAGNGTTTFNLPNLKGKVPVGYNSSETEFDAIGETGGEKTHLLTGEESGIASHSHGQQDWSSGTGSTKIISQTTSYNATPTTDRLPPTTTIANTNALSAHNNLQPYITLSFIIKT